MEHSPDPWRTAVHLAIAGNLMDMNVRSSLRQDRVQGAIYECLTERVDGDMPRFADAAARARQVGAGGAFQSSRATGYRTAPRGWIQPGNSRLRLAVATHTAGQPLCSVFTCLSALPGAWGAVSECPNHRHRWVGMRSRHKGEPHISAHRSAYLAPVPSR